MSNEFTGKTALVTGGNSGIGRAVAVALAERRAHVVLSGRDAARGDQVAIRELRAFSAVAEEGSVSAAGRKLHLSQSAVSQTIQSLERQLGVQLLIRGAGGVTLTTAGRRPAPRGADPHRPARSRARRSHRPGCSEHRAATGRHPA